MALAIDGSATFAGTGTSVQVTLSTSNANDIICLTIAGNITAPTGVSDAAGLTWVQRKAINITGQRLEFWYAKAPNALSSDVITVTFATSQTPRLVAWGVSGANYNSPFDGNASLPAQALGTVAATSQSANMTTDNAATMLLGLLRVSAGWGASLTRPSGWTMLLNVGTAQDTAYRIVSAAEANANKAWSWSNSSTNLLILDAIRQAAVTGTAAATLGEVTCAASGAEKFSGAIAATVGLITMAAVGFTPAAPESVVAYRVPPRTNEFSVQEKVISSVQPKTPIVVVEPYKIG